MAVPGTPLFIVLNKSASELPCFFLARVRSGPRPPPRAPSPWQKAQLARNSYSPSLAILRSPANGFLACAREVRQAQRRASSKSPAETTILIGSLLLRRARHPVSATKSSQKFGRLYHRSGEKKFTEEERAGLFFRRRTGSEVVRIRAEFAETPGKLCCAGRGKVQGVTESRRFTNPAAGIEIRRVLLQKKLPDVALIGAPSGRVVKDVQVPGGQRHEHKYDFHTALLRFADDLSNRRIQARSRRLLAVLVELLAISCFEQGEIG